MNLNSMSTDKQRDGVGHIPIREYDYPLPPDRVAAYPLEKRDASRLLVYDGGQITDTVFGQLDRFLSDGSLMILNDTKVIQARLEFFKTGGARIEVFCLQPVQPVRDVQLALGQSSPSRWFCLVGNAKRWRTGSLEMISANGRIGLRATMAGRTEDGFLIDFSWEPSGLSFAEVLEELGRTPLPPYINRRPETLDRHCYQTTYARDQGSVAAPTAGLHFTPGMFERLHKKGIGTAFVTLHVGAGTFKPVSAETIGLHRMHREQFVAGRSLLHSLLDHRGDLVSVGTTSMRTLESLYWIGARMSRGENPPAERISLSQWEPYAWQGPLPESKQALNALLEWMDSRGLEQLQGETSLMIAPGYPFRMTDALVTNFHQPQSTLLLLVAAFAGEGWKLAYAHALTRDYRFLSYGDACLFFRQESAHQ